MLVSHLLNHNHDIKEVLRVIHFQFFYMPVSYHYNTQTFIGPQWYMQPTRCKHAPRTFTFNPSAWGHL